VTKYQYDPRGLQTRVTDANGHTTTSAYDAAGQLVSQTDPLGGVRKYSYGAG
jgi:YD repeat-containing protein